jgi:hypothetical protein
MKFTVVASGLALITAPALAQAPGSDGPVPAAKLDPRDPNAIRCRKIEVTGSLVKKERICKTNAEWVRSRDQQQRDADDLITRSRSGMNPNG